MKSLLAASFLIISLIGNAQAKSASVATPSFQNLDRVTFAAGTFTTVTADTPFPGPGNKKCPD